MSTFAVIEIEDGFEIVEVLPGQSPIDAARAAGGSLVDPGPYENYEDAMDALDELEIFDERE